MSITIQQPEDRFVTDIGWLDSKHSFIFGQHYDRQHRQPGLLLVNNADIVAAGAGCGTHGHRDMEIVTWVLSGQVAHRDSEGNNG
ncbi:MAG: yhhW 2, partial [Ilumatobacteraceae bacterium]|nr:yhhW 2 [Ilumatobacteraceae bacterium]